MDVAARRGVLSVAITIRVAITICVDVNIDAYGRSADGKSLQVDGLVRPTPHPCGRAGAGITTLRASAASAVRLEPMKAYQVQAMGVAVHT